MCELIWAPEIHRIDGKWYIYFAAAHTQALDKLGMFQHRMFVLECTDADPLSGVWEEKGQIKTHLIPSRWMPRLFSHQGKQWYLWAQKAPDIAGTPISILPGWKSVDDQSAPVMLSKPEYGLGVSGFSRQ
ncbi:glycosyl hydrolase [Citrobacter koseri]|uniref:Glycosyl hydrolase n=1 Tax=Citrobacter koseri TaxID=545 RepID=A0A3S4M9V2_CITKO|nr:glycosyl hydrolase [Citrobacter koseri]